MKKPIIMILTIAISILNVANLQASDFSKKGSIWLGGEFGFTSEGFDGAPSRSIDYGIMPITRFFPVNHLMVGPSFQYYGTFFEKHAMNQFGIGADIGLVFSVKDKLYSYIRSGGNLILFGGNVIGKTLVGFSIPIAGGIIIPVGDIFAFQIEPAFTIVTVDGSSVNRFGIGIGIGGIGGKSLVTATNTMIF